MNINLETDTPNKELIHKKPSPKTFHHVLDIYLKDSNAYGNTYFARHFEWQGICRERWFHQCIQADMLQTLGVLITKEAHQEYINETFPFQTVDCFLNTYNIKKCSFFFEIPVRRGGKARRDRTSANRICRTRQAY